MNGTRNIDRKKIPNHKISIFENNIYEIPTIPHTTKNESSESFSAFIQEKESPHLFVM